MGENVTYVCTLHVDTVIFGHLWNIPGIDNVQIVLLDSVDKTVMGFTLRRVQEVDRILSTSVSVTAFSELNGSAIECREATLNVEVQSSTVLVDGELLCHVRTTSFLRIKPILIAKAIMVHKRIIVLSDLEPLPKPLKMT